MTKPAAPFRDDDGQIHVDLGDHVRALSPRQAMEYARQLETQALEFEAEAQCIREVVAS